MCTFWTACTIKHWNSLIRKNKMDNDNESDVTMHRFNRRNGQKFTIKVTNNDTGAVFVHKYVTKEEADWIDLDPNLTVEFLKR